ncbi:polymeric immunoglobulin receptor-like [Puntigrus tetrazona]|uniref:polymeric immunoglobulin receptor-like n=1 Tax=Puntigrus tetrazona TaxID=1606681 RepID=UPI001C895457|nr:polymeric immunoglobulin receptor-like [Puntigrus tetrazona]
MYSTVDMIYLLILSGILLHISDAGSGAMNIGVKSGSPGIIPCLYDKKYEGNRKYWCMGYSWSTCSILNYANGSGKYSLTDYPAQSIFTVQWENLQTSDSGYYWCAAEIGDYNTRDYSYYLYLTVQSAPDVSVVSSSVSEHEAGDISVQCLYSSRYQYKTKQWCRYKDERCYTVGRTDTSQSSSVQISDDDGRRSFTVLMTGLRLTDSGWYFCSVGDLQAPVQLTVTEPERVFTTTPASTPSPSEADIHTSQPSVTRNPTTMKTESSPETDISETHPSLTASSETVNSQTHSSTDEQKYFRRDVILVTCLPAILLLLLVTLVAIVTWRLRKKQKRPQNREEAHFNGTTMSCENPTTSNSPADDPSHSVIYSSVVTFPKAPSSSLNSDGGTMYSSVRKHPRP